MFILWVSLAFGGICSDEDRFCRKRTNANVFWNVGIWILYSKLFLSRISLSHKKWLLFLFFLVTNFRFSGIGVGTKTMTSPILERFVTPEFCRTQENCFGLIITDAEIETEMGGGLFWLELLMSVKSKVPLNIWFLLSKIGRSRVQSPVAKIASVDFFHLHEQLEFVF